MFFISWRGHLPIIYYINSVSSLTAINAVHHHFENYWPDDESRVLRQSSSLLCWFYQACHWCHRLKNSSPLSLTEFSTLSMFFPIHCISYWCLLSGKWQTDDMNTSCFISSLRKGCVLFPYFSNTKIRLLGTLLECYSPHHDSKTKNRDMIQQESAICT